MSFNVHFPDEGKLVHAYETYLRRCNRRARGYGQQCQEDGAKIGMGETGSDVLFGAVEDFAAERDPNVGLHARLTGWLTFQEQFVPKHRDPQEIAALHTALDEYLATLRDPTMCVS